MAITPPSASACRSVAVSEPNAASSALGSIMRNTVEKVSCDGTLRATELGHLAAARGSAQHGHERHRKELDEVVPLVVGSRIWNALERAQQELHGETPSKLR